MFVSNSELLGKMISPIDKLLLLKETRSPQPTKKEKKMEGIDDFCWWYGTSVANEASQVTGLVS